MGNTFFIGDTHFDDGNIIDFAERPFANVKEMNKYIVDKWNETILEDDVVYIVGDFVHPKYSVETADLILGLNGHKILIRGNHDTLSDEEYYELGIEKVYDHPIILDNFYIVSHEPMFMNNAMPYVNIFAHVHNNPIYTECGKKHFCVSLERPHLDYAPLIFNEIKRLVMEEYEK